MRHKFKIAFVILLVVTIVWALACFQHVQAYNNMIEKKKQQVGEYIVEKLMDFKPVWIIWNGPLLLIIGFFVIFAWICFLTELYRLRKGVRAYG